MTHTPIHCDLFSLSRVAPVGAPIHVTCLDGCLAVERRAEKVGHAGQELRVGLARTLAGSGAALRPAPTAPGASLGSRPAWAAAAAAAALGPGCRHGARAGVARLSDRRGAALGPAGCAALWPALARLSGRLRRLQARRFGPRPAVAMLLRLLLATATAIERRPRRRLLLLMREDLARSPR